MDALIVLHNAGLSSEIAKDIVLTMQQMKIVDRTKYAIRMLRALHNAYKNLYEWVWNYYWDLEEYIQVLFSNYSNFINETWFKDNWKFLFNDLLRSIMHHLDMMIMQGNCSDEFFQTQIQIVNNNVIYPLNRMQQATKWLTRTQKHL